MHGLRVAHSALIFSLFTMLWTTCAAFSMSFTKDIYVVEVLEIEGTSGKELLKVQFNESKRLVKEFIITDYSIYHSPATVKYFSIDNNGTIYIKESLPFNNRYYYFQVTALYTVVLYSGKTHTGFAYTYVNIKGIGPLHFDNSTYKIVMSMEHRVQDTVFDFGQHIVHNTDSYHGIHYQLTQPYRDSYCHIDNTTGELFISRATTPAESFSIHVSFNYSVTLKNSTIVKGSDKAYVIIRVAGCKYSLGANTVWESRPPCTIQQVPCSKVACSFGSGHVTRLCGADGKWSAPNYSQCKVKEKPGAFVAAWINYPAGFRINNLKNITKELSSLFPPHGISNVTLISGFYLYSPNQHLYCHPFTLGFKLAVNPLVFNATSSNNILKLVDHQINVQRKISRAVHTCPIEGMQGIIRMFNVTSTCEHNTQNDDYVIHLCSGDNCNRSNYNTIANNESCKAVLMKRKNYELYKRGSTHPTAISSKDDGVVGSTIK